MELDKRNIEEYINRFLEGETTNAEEQAIYRFFHTGDVPSHLMGYAPMFAWYEGGMQGEPGMSQPDGQEEVAGGKRSEKIPVVGKEGFFRVANCGGRSYLLDPDNGAVIIHGIQHVRPGESTAHKKAFGTRYGSEARWSEETGKLLADNHINYISYGSNRIEVFPAAVRGNLLTPKTQKIAYAENLYLLRTFMWDMSKNLGYAFDDDKYNRLVLLFEPTFATYIDRLVQEKSALFAGDRHFIGFYLDNELPFASYQGTGYANTEGGGWLVHTQKNRGEFYQNFCLRLLETRNCVGWVHFEYNDGYDSNGKASNKGVVSIEYEPYESFLSQMRQLNLSVHSLIDYYDIKSVQ